ncbi:hypothetical protein F5884DRAFT_874457 [Xylogone sp. PMI_703]|nr:hypothetical protein F5884DRAFT_874457 [Xylogone sp. PMI_703]
MSFKLIKGGNVLQFDSQKKASFPQLDILVQGQDIAKVAPSRKMAVFLADNKDPVEVINATNCIVSPGLIDGHRHTFQSQLRTTVANHTLLEYCAHLLQGRMVFLDPDDMYLAQLAGASEALWAGVTTIMDHSHVVISENHARKVLQATLDSGIRSIFCVSPFAIPVSLNPMVLPDMSVRHAEQVGLFKKMASEKPLGGSQNDGRVTIGFGYDTIFFQPIENSREVLTFAEKNDIPVTFHDVDRYNLAAFDYLHQHNLPMSNVTLSHVCDPTEEKLILAKKSGLGIVTTPESELQMSHGTPSGFQFLRAGCRVGLGIDSPAICSGDLFVAMRLLLQEQRAREHRVYTSRNKLSDTVTAHVDEVLYMATLGGAQAIHRENSLGSIEQGKKADIILIRTDSPSMISSVDYGAAMVMHANAADVDTVLVNGEIVKHNGVLLRVDWPQLAGKLRDNRAVLERRWRGIDWDMNKKELKTLWGMNDGRFE